MPNSVSKAKVLALLCKLVHQVQQYPTTTFTCKDVEWKDQEVARGSPASSPIAEHYKFSRRQSKNDVLG